MLCSTTLKIEAVFDTCNYIQVLPFFFSKLLPAVLVSCLVYMRVLVLHRSHALERLYRF
jgi:hypothetical protein